MSKIQQGDQLTKCLKHNTTCFAEGHCLDECENVNCADRGSDTDNVNPVSVAALINTGTC